ncbi:MAG: hypothetical protein WDN31_02890 [Hyphomicrobium sp.]
MLALASVSLSIARAQDGGEAISVQPQQAVTFGGGDGDTFAIEDISPHENMVTVLLRPMGETCSFRFPVMVGRSVQLRADTPSGQSLMCKATLRPITEDGTAQFTAECNEEPISREPKCPPGGDTAANIYPQH